MGNRRRNAAEARGPVLELERRGAGVRRRGCPALGRELAAARLSSSTEYDYTRSRGASDVRWDSKDIMEWKWASSESSPHAEV